MTTGKRKERQKSDTERHGIPPQPPWFFTWPDKATIHGTDSLRPHPTGNRVLLKDMPHSVYWLDSYPIPRVLKFTPLTLSYRASLPERGSSICLSLESSIIVINVKGHLVLIGKD